MFILNSSKQHCLKLPGNYVLVLICRSEKVASLWYVQYQSLISVMEVSWQIHFTPRIPHCFVSLLKFYTSVFDPWCIYTFPSEVKSVLLCIVC